MRSRSSGAALLLAVALTACGSASDVGDTVVPAVETTVPTASSSPLPTDAEPTVSASASPVAREVCPATSDDGQPPAARGLSTADRLAPDEVPTAVVVCRFGDYLDDAQQSPPPYRLTGERALSGPFDRVPDDLALSAELDDQRNCPFIDQLRTPYLVRLTYGDNKVLWLADTDRRCPARVTNGTFLSDQTVSATLRASFDAGRWVPDELSEKCVGTVGRAGQDHQLVPSGWTAVHTCDEDRTRRGTFTEDQGRRLVALLEDLPTAPSDGSGHCEASRPDNVPGTDATSVVFDYPRGRSVVVRIDVGCTPAISNRTLAAAATRAEREAVQAVLDE